jgi:hypothetical protein
MLVFPRDEGESSGKDIESTVRVQMPRRGDGTKYTKEKAILSWSGGKGSVLTLSEVRQGL